jgi:hypothetical protein
MTRILLEGLRGNAASAGGSVSPDLEIAQVVYYHRDLR